MKKILFILTLLVAVVVWIKQPQDALQKPTPHTQAPDRWRNWFQDERIPPLAERVSNIETKQDKIPILEEQLKKIAVLEEALKKMAVLEARINRLALLEKKIGLLENGFVLAKKSDAEWKLIDLFSRQRQYHRPVVFSQAFPVPPKIMLGITQINLPGEKVHFLTRAEEISTHGFTLVFETRSDSRVEEVQVDWLAFSSRPSAVTPVP